MSRQFLTNIDLNKNQLLNVAFQTLATAPGTPVTGQAYFDTTSGSFRQWDGSKWLTYVSAENGTEFVQSADGNFVVVTGQLHLAADLNVDTSLSVGGTATAADGKLQVKTANGNLIGVMQPSGTGGDFQITAWNNNLVLTADGHIVAQQQVEAQNGVTTTSVAGIGLTGDLGLYSGGDMSGVQLYADGHVQVFTNNGQKAYYNGTTDDKEIATKGYVDGVAQGLNVKESVVTASTDNYDLTTVITNPVFIVIGGWGGPGLDWGSRVLLIGQTDPTQNGIYVIDQTAQKLVRAADQLTPEVGDFVFVELGVNRARGYIVQAVNITGSYWTQFSAAGEYTAGNAINISGNTIALKYGSGLTLDGSGNLIPDLGSGLSVDGSNHVSVNLSTGLVVNGSNQIAFDDTYGVRKLVLPNPDLTSVSGAVTWVASHGFNVEDVEVQVKDVATGSVVEVDVQITDSNTVTLSWVSAGETAGAYRAIFVG